MSKRTKAAAEGVPTTAPAAAEKKRSAGLLLAAAVAAGVLVFIPALGGDFVYDDTRQIVRNPLIQDLSLAGRALTSDVWAFRGDGGAAASNYYRPTFVLWLIVNFRLFGLEPAGWHWSNIQLHAAVCGLIFLVLRRWGFSKALSFAVTLIFAVHPVHTESVAWISGAPDLLLSLFLLGSIWFAENLNGSPDERPDQRPEKRSGPAALNLGLAIILFALAVGAKEVGILCFFVFLLIFNRTRSRAAAARLTGAFLAAAVFYFVARLVVLGAFALPREESTGIGEAVLTVPAMFVFYLRQILFPGWLGANYPLRPIAEVNFTDFFLPLLISAAAVAVFWHLARRSRVQRIGLALFILPLLPALNATAFPAEQIVHDRYLYLPLLGFLILVLPFFADLVAKFDRRRSDAIIIAAAIVVSLPLGVKTFAYSRVWTSETALWRQSVEIDPSSAFNWAQLGAAQIEAGQPGAAVAAYNKSIAVRATPRALLGRARGLLQLNRPAEAVADARAVIEMPDDRIDVYALYQSYEVLAAALAQQGAFAEAQKFLSEARRRLPIYHAALTEKLAVVLYQAGDKAAALRELEGARQKAKTELLPESKAVLWRLGMLYAEFGRRGEAVSVLQEYLRATDGLRDKLTLADRSAAQQLLKSLQ